MSRPPHFAPLTLLLFALVLLGGCARCGGDSQPASGIATLSALSGSGVTRDFALKPQAWQAARVGELLGLGDGAQTDAVSTAELTFINGATLALQPSTTVRLMLDAMASAETEAAFDVQAGEALLRVGKRGLSLRTHVGLATIAPESEVRLTRQGDTIGFDVSLGALNFRDRDAGTVGLRSGDSVSIGIGMAILELRRAGGDESPVLGTDGGVLADASLEAEELPPETLVEGQAGPPHRHMLTRAGESFVVHTPEAPISVGFEFGPRCPAGGLIELVGTRQAVRGQERVNVQVAAGVRPYALRCLGPSGTPGRVAARGTVQVLVDAGTRKLPPKAPSSKIDADGRTYRIHYQNQLPEVTVRWPQAPVQDSYRLELDGKTIDLTKPEHSFRSGTLGDGVHTLSFQAQGRRSRTTTVEVLFDNVAPKASLSAPDDRGFAPGDTVTVEGVALPSWKVALEGGTITMSGDRFSGQVQTNPESPYISVRLSHPRLGTHYYLRRASGSP